MTVERARWWLRIMAGFVLGAAAARLVGLWPNHWLIDVVAPEFRVLLGFAAALGCAWLAAIARWPEGAFSAGTPAPTLGPGPWLLDTSALIDGRIADVATTGVIEAELLIPEFILHELQLIADQGDKLKRARGRRGLEIVHRLQGVEQLRVTIDERRVPARERDPIDARLVQRARELSGKIVTSDFNLNRVAQAQGVGVVNLNDLAAALRPAFLPGEMFEIVIAKPGEEPHQGVGYLSDGTMVVVQEARERLQQTVRVVVTSVLQTSAGRLVFARLHEGEPTA